MDHTRMMDLYLDPRFALCSNPECGASVEYICDIDLPVFCSRCKWPLFTRCLHCHFPFVYRPEMYCSMCSKDLFRDHRPYNSLIVLIDYVLREFHGHEQQAQTQALVDNYRLKNIAKYFPLFLLDRSSELEDLLRTRGLDILLAPLPEKQKNSFLKLVKDSE